MIDEIFDVPTVVAAPFGILSSASTVLRDEDFGEFPVVRTGSPINVKSIDWSTEASFDDATSIYTAPEVLAKDASTFRVHIAMTGSTFTLNRDPTLPEKIVDAYEESALQKSIEKYFWKELLAAPSTSSTTAAGKIKIGVSLAESTFSDVSAGERGVVHMPRAFANLYKGKLDEDALYDHVGTPIVAGGGYSTSDNKLFITGPVTVRISEPSEFTEVDNVKNSYTYFREFEVSVSYIDGPVSATVDLSLE